MKLITVVGALTLCSLAVIVETKPFLAVKVVHVPVPVLVPKIPKINILGLLGKALHAKAALVGGALKAKGAFVGHLLGSSSGPIIGVVRPQPQYPEPIYPAAAPPQPPPPPPPPPPSTSYGTPA